MRNVGSSHTGAVSLSQGLSGQDSGSFQTAASFVAGLDPQFQVAAALEASPRVFSIPTGLVPVGGFLTHRGGLR